MLDYIQSGKEDGAKLECGGHRWGQTGYYIQPTVFSDVTDDMKIAREEVISCYTISKLTTTIIIKVFDFPRYSDLSKVLCGLRLCKKLSIESIEQITDWLPPFLRIISTMHLLLPRMFALEFYGISICFQKNKKYTIIFKEKNPFSFRINTYDAFSPHTPWGGFKQSGIGREL